MSHSLRLPTFLAPGLLRAVGPVAVLLLAVALLGTAPAAQADGGLENGGFESGDLTGWTTAGNVEVLSGSNFAPAITSPEGDFFALLSTGPESTGSGDSGADRDGSGSNESDIATLTQAFDVTASSALSFTVGFATSEAGEEYVDDIFEVLLDGTPVVQGSVPGVTGSPFSDFGVLDGIDYTVNSSGSTNGSSFNDGMTATAQYNVLLAPGPHTIEFFVGDEEDEIVDSGLIVDNLVLTPLITLEPPTDTNEVGTDHTVIAIVEFAGQPMEGTEVTFEVIDGPNVGEVSDPNTGECTDNDDCTADVNGNVSWTYTGAGGVGTDTIEACSVPLVDHVAQVQVQPEPICATASKTWEELPTPTPTATPIPTPSPTAVLEVVELPATGGTPSDGGSGLAWLAAIAGAIAVMSGGGFWVARRTRRVR